MNVKRMKQGLADPKIFHKNPWNSNSVNPKNMQKLCESIKSLGFNSAVIVRELTDGTLQILGGSHRIEAAIELGLKEVPYLNLGVISDVKAKKVGLVDNSRYGSDDSLQLARLIEDIRIDTPDLTTFLPLQDEDLQSIMRAVDIDLDSLDIAPEHEEEAPYDPEAGRVERPLKTHDILSFRVTMREAEAIRTLIEKTIKREGLDDGSDDKTVAGAALSHMLLNESE